MDSLKKSAKIFLYFIFIFSLILLIYTSIIYFKQSIDIKTINKISYFILLLSLFILGLLSGLIFKKRGLINGFLMALILFTFIFIYHFIVKSLDIYFLIKALSGLLTSALGGFLGANLTKIKIKKRN